MPSASATAYWGGTLAPEVAVAGTGREVRPGREPLTLFVAHRGLDEDGIEGFESAHEALPPPVVDGLFASAPGIEELMLLRTCQRVEVYAVASDARAVACLRGALPHPDRWRFWTGRSAAAHLSEVALGRCSMAVGEREIRDQLVRAARTTRSRHPRPILRTLVSGALGALPPAEVREASASSMAALAASTLLGEVGIPFPRVAILGAGVVGRRVAELLGAHTRLTLLYRSCPPNEEFLRSTGARAAPFHALAAEVAECDAVVTAAKAAGRLVLRADLEARSRRDRPLLVIDLGMPRNVDPAVAELPNVRLVNLSQLRRPSRRRTPDLGAEELAERATERIWAEFERFALEPLIGEMFRRAERARRETVAASVAHFPTMSPAQWRAVDDLTRRLVRRLLGTVAEARREIVTDPPPDRGRAYRPTPRTPVP
ncbi:MAG TPA: hypothetical protein VFF67_04690 [Thermoplasmata archaeon]|nr:hypothetical protein [Thermoplasmata archaeon]